MLLALRAAEGVPITQSDTWTVSMQPVIGHTSTDSLSWYGESVTGQTVNVTETINFITSLSQTATIPTQTESMRFTDNSPTTTVSLSSSDSVIHWTDATGAISQAVREYVSWSDVNNPVNATVPGVAAATVTGTTAGAVGSITEPTTQETATTAEILEQISQDTGDTEQLLEPDTQDSGDNDQGLSQLGQ